MIKIEKTKDELKSEIKYLKDKLDFKEEFIQNLNHALLHGGLASWSYEKARKNIKKELKQSKYKGLYKLTIRELESLSEEDAKILLYGTPKEKKEWERKYKGIKRLKQEIGGKRASSHR